MFSKELDHLAPPNSLLILPRLKIYCCRNLVATLLFCFKAVIKSHQNLMNLAAKILPLQFNDLSDLTWVNL